MSDAVSIAVFLAESALSSHSRGGIRRWPSQAPKLEIFYYPGYSINVSCFSGSSLELRSAGNLHATIVSVSLQYSPAKHTDTMLMGVGVVVIAMPELQLGADFSAKNPVKCLAQLTRG